MTDREKAIVMAYTGKCTLTENKFQIFHKYVEEIMGRPVFTHELAELENAIKEKAKPDFIALCKDESSSENPNKSENSTGWIPVKWHEITDEEREREGYPKDWACYLDCIMPYDGQRILITTKGGFVELDECYSDDGRTFSLDSSYDWIDDVIAWCELPEPYKAESEG